MSSEQWAWMMDYCFMKGWHPGEPKKWEAAYDAFLKWEKTVEAKREKDGA